MSTEAERQAELERFKQRYGVKPYQHTYLTMMQFLKQGGASKKDVVQHLIDFWNVDPDHRTYLGSSYGAGEAFDHLEFWGRDGKPLFLIGHPYALWRPESFAMLTSMMQLGLSVRVDRHSWYGPGTIQIIVDHFPTIHKVSQDLLKYNFPA